MRTNGRLKLSKRRFLERSSRLAAANVQGVTTHTLRTLTRGVRKARQQWNKQRSKRTFQILAQKKRTAAVKAARQKAGPKVSGWPLGTLEV